MCHTAINALGGSSESQAFEGGLIPMQNWYAPSLTSNKEAGLGDWSIEEISDLLRTGISNRGAVYGPMAEVVYNSLQYLTDDDTRAMAVYLKSLAQGTSPDEAAPPLPSAGEQPAAQPRQDRSTTANAPVAMARRGSACRRIIRRSPATSRSRWSSAVNAIRMVLNGGYPPGTAGNPMPYGMPPFAQRLSDDEVAAVVTYIRTSWGNRGDAGFGAAGQRTARGDAELRRVMINSSRRDVHVGSEDETPSTRSCAPARAARSRSRASRPRSSIALWFAFYLLVFLPRSV